MAVTELERAQKAQDKSGVTYNTRLLERIDTVRRPKQVRLTLQDVIQRTLGNNYAIQTVSYNPAIEQTRVVEAEAAFDAVFFTGTSHNKIDRPTASELASTKAEFTNVNAGLRKLLPTGAQVSGQYVLNRNKQNFQFQTLNPAYTSNFILESRQPLLRNFGLDFNRSLILIALNDQRIGTLTFRQQVRDTLRTVEGLYWRLVQARRDVVVTARELADFEVIYEFLVARKDFDMTPVQIESTRADLELARADFIRRRQTLFNAQDRLIAGMNDPELNLADVVELVPADFPQLERFLVDRLAEVQTALDFRTEIKEQELRVANAKIGVGRAKNAELPQLDLTFRVTWDGLGGNADQSFDEATDNEFIEYFVGVELEMPIGNRGPRAGRRRAELLHAQSISELQRVFEDIILDVNLAVRQLESTYDQIVPDFESAVARERQVESIVARAERKDINTLQTELNARQSLAATRRALMNDIVEYNIAIVELERAKGTLLDYNNVVIPDSVSPSEPLSAQP